MEAKDVLKIITKQWCDHDDLKSLSQLGDNALCKFKKEITNELLEQGYLLPKGLLPMDYVVEKLKINIDYLIKISKL